MIIESCTFRDDLIVSLEQSGDKFIVSFDHKDLGGLYTFLRSRQFENLNDATDFYGDIVAKVRSLDNLFNQTK